MAESLEQRIGSILPEPAMEEPATEATPLEPMPADVESMGADVVPVVDEPSMDGVQVATLADKVIRKIVSGADKRAG